MAGKKILIAYYSYSGNTKSTAEKIQSVVGGDLFEIKPVQQYPNDYNEVVAIAKKEKAQNFKPELIKKGDISGYDTIFIGTPVWWWTFATPVRTFLSENDFTGKTIMPFCTHGGGGASSTYLDIQKLCPNADVKEGYTTYNNSATENEIKNWLEGLI
ncbi:flavodoxin [bacterium]|nr:flavodoxin [bacterium]